MIDSFLRRFGEVLADDTRRRLALKRLRHVARGLMIALVFAYAAILLLGTFLLLQVGERNLTVAFALYVPRVIFLAPIIFLLPLSLILNWRISLALIGVAAVFWHSGMGWQFRTQPDPTLSEPGKSLTVLTYNRGQHMNQSLQPFKNTTRPDLLLLQEAPHRAARYAGAEGYEEFGHTADAGEFTLLSRYPILSKALIEIPLGERPSRPAARFEIDFAGTRVVVYTVHFISPRDTLNYYRRGAFLWGVLGLPGTPWAEKRRLNQPFWDQRIDQAAALARQIASEDAPTLVTGDFNAPAGGYIHGLFLDGGLRDAHREAGSGFGYTFPGTTRNPLSLGGPWMRIDYLFADEAHWEVEWCLTEPDRPSQHRAVAAQFRLRESTR